MQVSPEVSPARQTDLSVGTVRKYGRCGRVFCQASANSNYCLSCCLSVRCTLYAASGYRLRTAYPSMNVYV